MRRFTRKALPSTLTLILPALLCALALAGGVLLRAAPAAAAGQGGQPADPLLLLAIQQAKLTAPDGAADDAFGWSVAVSGDTALVGAPNVTVDTHVYQGSAYVFVRSAASWTLQQKLTASDGDAYDGFGWSVALDGDTALVGAWEAAVNYPYGEQGSAWVFVRSGTSWSQQQRLVGDLSPNGRHANFGYSVALSGDTALVGARGDDLATYWQGSAYVFVCSGASWTLQQQLVASDGEAEDHFGEAVALDDDTALVGAPGDENPRQGSAYVFVRNGTSWSEQQQFVAGHGVEAPIGDAVALSGDTALVESYVFVRSGAAWWPQQRLIGLDPGNGSRLTFTGAVALSGDAALFGISGDYPNGQSGQGSAYLFVRSGTSWSQRPRLLASDGAANDGFGWSVALSGDTALLGADYDDVDSMEGRGSAYVFTDLKAVTDTTPPTTTAFAATVKRGKTAVLKYRVNDPAPNGGTATVTIKVKNKAGEVVKTLKPVVKPVNTPQAWRFTVPPTWKAGAYRFYVYATDMAGNTQSKVGYNTLTVK